MATVTPSVADPVHYTIVGSKAFVGDLRLRVGSALPAKTVQIIYPNPAPAGLVVNLIKTTAPTVSQSLLTPIPPGTYPDIDVNVNIVAGATTTMTVTIVAAASWSVGDLDIDWQIQLFASAPQNYELHQPNNNVSIGAVTVRRMICDPTSAMAAPGAVLEKNNFTLAADGATDPLTNTVVLTPGGGMSNPGVLYRWTHAANISVPPLDSVFPATTSPVTNAPGVYGATPVAFTQRTMVDVWDQLFQNSPPQTLTINPRNYRMILLLDRSGSMLANLGGGESKWVATVKAAHVWADLFVVFRNGVNAGDLAAVMIFEAMPCGWSATVAAPIQIRVPNTGLMGTIGSIDATSASFSGDLQNPGACTPIGDALIAAMTNLGTGATPDDRIVLVLMTDGMENSGRIVVDNDIPLPAGAVSTFDAERLLGIPGTINSAMQLYTIGVGSTVQASVLDDLPNPPDIASPVPAPPAVGAYYRMANTTQELLPTFAQILGHALEAQAVAPTYDAVLHTMTFPVPAGEHRIAVVLQWASSADDLKISYNSGGGFVQIYGTGTPAPPPAGSVTVRRRDTHGIAVVDLALLGVAGVATDWKIEYVPLVGPNDIDAAKFLVMVDLNVKAEFFFDRARYFTGDPMVVSCRLTAGGAVVTDARVSVELARPGEGLGTFLAVNGAGYQPPPAAGADPAGGKAAMTQVILRKKEMQDLPVVTPPAIFTDGSRRLLDDGAHSDGRSRDGVYANVYANADREGTYTWRFHVEGTVPGGGKFTRLMTVSKWVGVNVDPLSSGVTVAPATPTVKGMQAAQVSVVPVDRKGQYLGPFRQGSVKFSASAGQFGGTMTSHPDGRYSQVLHYPPGTLPLVTVSVQGKEFAPIPAAPGCLGMLINAVRARYQWLLRLGRGS